MTARRVFAARRSSTLSKVAFAALALLGLVACDAAALPPGADADRADAQPFANAARDVDAGAPEDGGLPLDATAPDAGSRERSWRHQDVGEGANASLAIAPDGTVHIGHTLLFNDGTGRILHSQSVGARFETEVVAAGGGVGWNVALALQGAEPRIAFSDPAFINGATGVLSLARPGEEGWTVDPLPVPGAVGVPVALAYLGDVPSILYSADGWTSVREGSGTWAADVLSDGNPRLAGFSAELLFDSTGVAHVVFSEGDEAPTYGRLDGEGWMFESVGSVAQSSPFVDLALGSDGQPVVAYVTGQAVRVAERTPVGWTDTTVAEGIDAATVAVAIDGDGVTHLVYSDADAREVVYATSADDWAVNAIASSGVEGTSVDIAIGPEGRPHVAYTVFSPASSLRLAVLR